MKPVVEVQDTVRIVSEPDPENYGEAMSSQFKNKWLVEFTEELTVLDETGVWAEVLPLEDSHVFHNKWVFKAKTDANDKVET